PLYWAAWLSPPKCVRALPDTARGMCLGQHRGRPARVEIVREQLAGHRAAAEARRREPGDDPQIVAAGDTADQRLAVEREGHQARPRARDRDVREEGQDRDRVVAVHVDALGVGGRVVSHQLAIAAEDDLAIAPLAPVEM